MQNFTQCQDQQLLSNFGGDGAAEDRASLSQGWKMLREEYLHAIMRIDLIVLVRRERQALARLDHQQLRDIGIDPATAALESRRNHFDIPACRLRKGRCN